MHLAKRVELKEEKRYWRNYHVSSISFSDHYCANCDSFRELVKRSLPTKKNYIPLIAFVMGIFIGIVSFPFTELEVTLRLWAGGIAGLANTGLFEITNYREGLSKEGK